MKVLIAREDKLNVEFLKEFLKREFEFEIYCSSIEEATEASKVELPNLILLDISTLRLNSFQLIDDLKNSIVTEDIPIIIFSTFDEQIIKNKTPLYHIDYIFPKPFDEELLKKAISETLSHENQFIGSYTNRFIKSFISFYSSQNTALKMIAILEALSYKINIQIQKKLDMKSVLAILSTTIKNQSLNKTIKLYKDMRFANAILELLEGVKNPKSFHQEIIYIIYEFQKADYKNRDINKLKLKSVDKELISLIKQIIDENRVIVKSTLDFELVWTKLMNVVINDRDIDFTLADDFINFTKETLRKIVIKKSEALIKIINSSSELNFIISANSCTYEGLTEILSINCPTSMNCEIKHIEDEECLVISLIKTVNNKIEIKPKDENRQKLLKKSILDGTRSASEYIESLGIDINSDLEEMEELEEEWESSSIFLENEEFNIEDFRDLGITISSYADRIHNTFYEFEAIGYALNSLANLIISKEDVSNISAKNIKKLTLLLELLKDDIIKWRKTVFIEQNTDNVHYLDSSLLSSCMQIESILKDEEIEEQDEDIEFF